MKKTIIAIAMLMSVTAVAQVQQDDSGVGGGGPVAAGSFSKPTNTVSNLGWATGQAAQEMEFEPSFYITAPTMTTMIASYRDSELNKKIIYAAREDAANHVATGGQSTGAQLAAALKRARETTNTNLSDMALALEILAITN